MAHILPTISLRHLIPLSRMGDFEVDRVSPRLSLGSRAKLLNHSPRQQKNTCAQASILHNHWGPHLGEGEFVLALAHDLREGRRTGGVLRDALTEGRASLTGVLDGRMGRGGPSSGKKII